MRNGSRSLRRVSLERGLDRLPKWLPSHNATKMFARRLAHVDNIPQQDSAQNAFNKLARTFAAQVSALKDYRSKGEQKMTGAVRPRRRGRPGDRPATSAPRRRG